MSGPWKRLCLSLLLLLQCDNGRAESVLHLGILAYRAEEDTQIRWQPLAGYLEHAIPGTRFDLVALNFAGLEKAIRERRLDFVLTQPAHYVQLAYRNGLSSPLATLVAQANGEAQDAYGGVIFTLSERRDIATLADLKGRRIAYSTRESLGGYQAQTYELELAGVRLSPETRLIEAGLPQDNTVRAVLENRAEVGFVRTGLLEAMAKEGKLDPSRLRIVNPQELADFPHAVSTRLYPQWAFAALNFGDSDLARKVTAALLSLPQGGEVAQRMGIHGFTIPADYRSVENLLRTLRLPPFEQTPEFTPTDVWRRYRWPILAAATMAALVLALAVRLLAAKRRLDDEHARVMSLIEGTQVGTWEWDIPTGRLTVDARWAEITGHTLDELHPVGIATWRELAHPDDLKHAETLLRRHFAGELDYYDCEYRLRHKQGHWVWVQDRGRLNSRNRDGKPSRMSGTRSDITERKRVEERLRLLAVALESAGDGIVITDPDARIEWVNKAFTRLTGYSMSEAIGRHPAELVKSGQQTQTFYQAMWKSIQGGREWRGEVINRKKNGELYTEQLTITPVLDAGGAVTHFVGIKEDITGRKRLEAELVAQATTDGLTGLANRRHFLTRLEAELARLRRQPEQVASLLMLDLDHFKQVNDTHGHEGGDAVLKHFAAVLSRDLRESDIAGRLGGEEFVVLLTGTGPEDAMTRAERLRGLVQASPVRFADGHIPFTVSIGVTGIAQSDAGVSAILRRADQALYRAKLSGRNRVELFKAAAE
ncbi:diguanylate cyclase [Methylococcus sp. EFPC2]|uniref:diguanylate cyclase n=1 Tax=Methylococcus sp. EFPC2 TaxID=2812648 RepID=UPI001966EE4D|nr:diguanylate cyclase [Methylococcus sp. EFPC2]QSA96582.1 diguanylate cyclase [Methylococcus sp. EFPC2]